MRLHINIVQSLGVNMFLHVEVLVLLHIVTSGCTVYNLFRFTTGHLYMQDTKYLSNQHQPWSSVNTGRNSSQTQTPEPRRSGLSQQNRVVFSWIQKSFYSKDQRGCCIKTHFMYLHLLKMRMRRPRMGYEPG